MSMKYRPGTVLTLDAGGTTLSFSSINSSGKPTTPVVIDAEVGTIREYIDKLVDGFENLLTDIAEPFIGISFAFPGPADYPNGVIGDLGNLPLFRGGVPLGKILEGHFNVPVFINNDANLFALGEAEAGLLPEINKRMSGSDQGRIYRNLLGITLGTGFGGGIVIDGKMVVGDNSSAGEIWLMRNKVEHHINAEEGVTIRSIRKKYGSLTGTNINDVPSPLEICRIADGDLPGGIEAAKESFRSLGEVLGDAIANAITLIDGAVVIGGGLSGASKYFLPEVLRELNGMINGFPRMESKAYNLEDEGDSGLFYRSDPAISTNPVFKENFCYEKNKKIPVAISRLGTAQAVAIGAYSFALSRLSR